MLNHKIYWHRFEIQKCNYFSLLNDILAHNSEPISSMAGQDGLKNLGTSLKKSVLTIFF